MTKTNLILKRLAYGLSAFAIAVVPFLSAAQTSAAQITARKVTIGSSVASAATTYSFTFTVPTATAIQSVDFAACTTASGACTPAPGFSSSSSTLTAQPTNLGSATGWIVNTATSTSLRLSNSGNVTAPTGSQTVGFSSVTNPSATNSTFFIRITTYSGSNWATGPLDTGVVAASTAGQITVNATVDETLTFTLASATVNLSPTPVSTGAASTGTSSMTASTNAASGYSITYSAPNSLRSAGVDIPAYSSQASSPGTAGFGINLRSNATPAVGTNVSGTGTATAVGVYNAVDSFTFVPAGGQVASVGVPSNNNTFTVSYVANISAITPAGAYTTAITYVATPNF